MAVTESITSSSLQLPCGLVLKNRLVKSAMSEKLAVDLYPTYKHQQLYTRWAQGGWAALIAEGADAAERLGQRLGHFARRAGIEQVMHKKGVDSWANHEARVAADESYKGVVPGDLGKGAGACCGGLCLRGSVGAMEFRHGVVEGLLLRGLIDSRRRAWWPEDALRWIGASRLFLEFARGVEEVEAIHVGRVMASEGLRVSLVRTRYEVLARLFPCRWGIQPEQMSFSFGRRACQMRRPALAGFIRALRLLRLDSLGPVVRPKLIEQLSWRLACL